MFKEQGGSVTPPAAVAAPTAAPASGAVLLKDSTVALACDTEGATIYYTTDGTPPTSESVTYSVPISLATAGEATIKAIAVKDSDESAVMTATYAVVEPVTIAAARGWEVNTKGAVTGVVIAIDGKNVVIQDATGGINAYFGTEPNGLAIGKEITVYGNRGVYQESYVQLSGAQLLGNMTDKSLPESTTLDVKSLQTNGGALESTSVAPSGQFAIGAYDSSTKMTTITQGDTSIAAKFLGDAPAEGDVYTISRAVVNSFKGTYQLLVPTDCYTRIAPAVEDVTANPAPGGYQLADLSAGVTLSSETVDAEIYYTTDGAEPTKANGTKYSSPITISGLPATIKAIAYKDVEQSNVETFTYTERVVVAPGKGPVTIYHVYGGGGNSGHIYKNDFVVLKNISNRNVDISGWSLQYAAGSNKAAITAKNIYVIPENTTINAGKYFVAVGKGDGNGAIEVTSPNMTCDMDIAGAGGQIILCVDSTPLPAGEGSQDAVENLADFVGLNSAVRFLGTSFGGGLGATASARRTDASIEAIKNPSTYTPNNKTDFEVIPATDESCLDYLNPLPLTASPAAGYVEKGTTVSLNHAIADGKVYYTMTTDGTTPQTPTTASTLYTAPIAINADVVTVKAILVSDTLGTSQVYTYTYFTAAATTIAVARKAVDAPTSSNETTTVRVSTKGVVTFSDGRNVTIQDSSGAEGAPCAIGIDFGSNGAATAAGIVAGKEIQVTGVWGHYRNWIQVKSPSVKILGDKPLPEPVAVTMAESKSAQYESVRIRLTDVLLGVINTGASTPITQSNKSMDIYKMPALGNDIYEGFRVDIIGVVGVLDTGYQLRVNAKEDVTKNAGFTPPTAVGTITSNPASGAKVAPGQKITFTCPTPGITLQYRLAPDGAWTNVPETGYTIPDSANGSFTLYLQATRSGLTASSLTITYQVGAIPIAEVRLGQTGDNSRIEGIVTWVAEDQETVTVQDDTAAIQVLLKEKNTTVRAGDRVVATGKLAVSEYIHQLQLATAGAFSIAASGQALPTPMTIGADTLSGKNMKAQESRRVTVPALQYVGAISGVGTFADVDGTEISVRGIPQNAGLILGKWYDVTGIVLPSVERRVTDFGNGSSKTEYLYTFYLQTPDSGWFQQVGAPSAPKHRWNVVQFSGNKTLVAEDNVNSVPADEGENKDGGVATLGSGNFLSQSGGHNAASGWNTDTQNIQFTFSTKGFEKLALSVNLRASGSGPRDLKCQYSLNGSDWTDLPGGQIVVLDTTMSAMSPTIKNMPLPAALANQETVYLRVAKASNAKQSGGVGAAGAVTYAGLVVSGTEVANTNLVNASVESGGVALNTQVTLSNEASSAIMYRVITEATPNSEFSAYSGAVTLAALPATIQAKAGDARVRSFVYTQAKVAPVTANYYSGKLTAGTAVRLSNATAGAAITYKLVTRAGLGGESTQADLIYDPSVGISFTSAMFPVRVEAIAAKEGWLNSETLTLEYTEKAAGAERLYFGQLHSHTKEYSDGAGTLAEALDYAKNRSGTDFVAFTDHSNYFDSASALGQMDDAASGLKSTVAGKSDKSMWQVYNETIDAATTNRFVALSGYEMTWSSGPGHINTFNSVGFASRNNATLNNKTNDSGMQAYYDLLTANPQTISQFNHPGATFGTFADFGYYTTERDSVVTMVEVGNGEGLVGSNGYFPSYQYYDMALSKGWHLAPTNNQDNHKGGWGNANTARTVALTDDLSKDGLLQAMRDRSLYATEDQNLSVLYTLNGMKMGSIMAEEPASLDFKVVVNDPDGEALGSIAIVTESGLELDKVTDINTSSYTWEPQLDTADYAYYYIRVVQADKDIAVTAPIWASEVKKMGITSLTTSADAQVRDEEMTITTKLYNSEATAASITSIEYSLTRLGTTNSLLKLEGDALTEAGLGNVPKNASRSHQLNFTPTVVGLQTLSVTVKMLLGSTEYTFAKNLELEVLDPGEIAYIAIDAAHNNFYVTGDYADSDTNFSLLAADKGVRTTRLTDAITYDAIENMDLLVLTVPYKTFGDGGGTYYSDAELNAIKQYADGGGNILLTSKSDRGDPVAAGEKASAISNGILAKLEAKMRIGAGIVIDMDSGAHAAAGGQESFRLYFKNPASFNADSPFTSRIAGNIGDGYSSYNAAPIFLNGATALVSGHSTTWGTEFSDLEATPYPPKPDATVITAKGETVVMGAETLAGGGFLIVSGTTFFSNKEIESSSGDDRQRYVNAIIAGNILEECKPAPVITNIADIQNTETVHEGEKFTVQGLATSNASGYDKTTAFFDCIYVQDKTGGINVFPVDANIQAGQTVQITGYVSSYLGERQLNARSVRIIDKTVKPLPAPKEITTAQLAAGSDLGALVKVRGVITRIDMKLGSPETIMVRDASGVDCRIFIDGYITSDKTIDNLAVGRAITAVGMASHDTLGARMRIFDRASIVCTTDYPTLPHGTSVAIPGLPNLNFCDWADAGDGSFMVNGVTIGEPSLMVDLAGTAIDMSAATVPVTGTLAHKEGFTGFWPDNTEMQSGHFLGFRLALPSGIYAPVITFGGKTITVKDGTADGRDYFDFIYRVNKAEHTSFDVTVDLDGEGTDYTAVTYTFGLAELICADKVIPIPSTGGTPTVRPGDVKESDTSVEIKLPSAGAKLNTAASEKVVAANATKPVTITGNGISITIPVGVLPKGTDVNSLLVNPKSKGNVIQVTKPDGTTVILPLAAVGGGNVAYIANVVGNYKVVDNTKTFPDVSGHWASKAIDFATAHEFFKGTSDGNFSPETPMTRGMLVTVLARIDGGKAAEGNAFVDVSTDAWYAREVAWAAQNKLVEGDSVTFDPDGTLTREQLCVISGRYLNYSGLTLSETEQVGEYPDMATVSPWAADAMQMAIKTGLIDGKAGGLLDPKGQASRAEIATILQRFVEGVLK